MFLNDAKLENWNMTTFPFDNATQIDQLISNVNQQPESTNAVNGLNSGHLWSGPVIFHGTFDIDQDEIVDTYINPTEWGKVGWNELNIISFNKLQHFSINFYYLPFFSQQ